MAAPTISTLPPAPLPTDSRSVFNSKAYVFVGSLSAFVSEVNALAAWMEENAGSGGGGTGTVTSVGLSVPMGFTISNSPVTGSGTLALEFALGYSLPSDAAQGQWNTAYNQRLRWDGGSEGLDAGNARTSIGATTVGSAFLTTPNPSAIRFPRVNANNSVSYLDAAAFLSAIGGLATSSVGVSVASLVGGLVPSSQLPSYVDDVLEFANLAAFPATGESGKIYIAQDTNYQYRWSGSSYVQIVASPGTTDNVPEGTTNQYFTQARVRSTPLTGFVATVGRTAIAATDTLLQAFNKIQGWLNASAKKTTVLAVSTSSHNLDTANESLYHRFTFNGAKTVTIRTNATHALEVGGAWPIANRSPIGDLTVTPADGTVTVNAPAGGSLVLGPGMTAVIQKVGTNEYDLIGHTVS